MFKDDNVFRDFLFALALIALVRLVYQQNAEQTVHQKPQQTVARQKSTLDRLLKKTAAALQQAITKAQANNNTQLQRELESLKKQWSDINRQYHQKIQQEDAITYLLGPLYAASKAAKERVLTKRLNTIDETITQMMQQAHIPQEKTSSRIAAVPV